MRNQEGLKLSWWEDLAHRSLGVGVVHVSNWKGKLQQGSGGTSWGLAGQGNQSEVWVKHWKRKNKLHTTHLAWNQDAWKQSFLCCQPVTWWNPSTQVSYPLQCLCQPCQRQPDGCSEPVLCQCSCWGLPVADQNTSALLLICLGIRVVPGQDISAFSICSFKYQHKSCRKTLLKLQIQVLQSLRLFA